MKRNVGSLGLFSFTPLRHLHCTMLWGVDTSHAHVLHSLHDVTTEGVSLQLTKHEHCFHAIIMFKKKSAATNTKVKIQVNTNSTRKNEYNSKFLESRRVGVAHGLVDKSCSMAAEFGWKGQSLCSTRGGNLALECQSF